MRLLVTGAIGFIGSHLCEGLLAAGHEVWGISRLTKTGNVAETQNHQNFHLLRCDITDSDELQAIFHRNKFDAIFHLAARLSTQPADDPFPYFETNVKGTLNILRTAHMEDVRNVVYSSSMNVYGVPEYLPVDEGHPTKPVNLYGLTKLMGEMSCQLYARIYGFKAIILRYSGVFGPGKAGGAIFNFVDKALRNEPLVIFSDGSDVWDTVYVKDVVAANILALANIDRLGFESFNIGIGKGINITDVANKILGLTGSAAKPTFGSAPSLPTFVYNISKAENMLGFTPTTFDECLKEYVEQEKSQRLTAKYEGS